MSDTPIKVISSEIDRIREELKKHSVAEISRKTGLHRNTIRNIANGTHAAPTLQNIAVLSAVLFGEK